MAGHDETVVSQQQSVEVVTGMHALLNMSWDPLSSNDWDREKPTEQCFLRIKR